MCRVLLLDLGRLSNFWDEYSNPKILGKNGIVVDQLHDKGIAAQQRERGQQGKRDITREEHCHCVIVNKGKM